MKNFTFLLMISLLFFGCTNKDIPHDPLKNELLAYTQKFESVKQDDRYLVVGTYLNPIHANIRNKANEEHFILSVYPQDVGIVSKTLKVNNDTNVSIKKLDENDPLLKLTTFEMPWGAHYEVIAPEKNSNYLTLTYQTDNSLNVSLKFMKISKSLYWNPKIELKDD